MTQQNRRSLLAEVLSIGMTFTLLVAATVPEVYGAEGGVIFRLEGPEGQPVPMNVTLQNVSTGEEYTFASAFGRAITKPIPAGKYKAYIGALWQGVAYVVDIQDVEVPAGDVATVHSSFAEGAGRVGLPAYDSDFDGVIDRVEHEVGTDRMDATDIPGMLRLEIDKVALKEEEGWYRGEFRSYSTYSNGRMRVRAIIRRAEKLGLDFVVITDKGSLESCKDEDFRSDKVLLIPAYEWGVEGHATLLGARTLIKSWDNNPQVQAAIRLAHAQGVIFCITDPCSSESPWEWTVSGFHAIEVWSKGWRSERHTDPRVLGRGERTKLTVPSSEIRSSLAVDNVCKNSQALKFWDASLEQGRRVTAVGGSGAFDRLADIGTPITYVYARELSVPGIIEGILLGRTFVSPGIDGPTVLFMADIDGDDKFEGVPGSVVPIPISPGAERYRISRDGKEIETEIVGSEVNEIRFRVAIEGLRERGTVKINVIKNGNVFRTEVVDPDKPVYDFLDAPWKPSFYRVELFRTASDKKAQQGYGNIEMLALTSPIYADFMPMPEKPMPEEERAAPQE